MIEVLVGLLVTLVLGAYAWVWQIRKDMQQTLNNHLNDVATRLDAIHSDVRELRQMVWGLAKGGERCGEELPEEQDPVG